VPAAGFTGFDFSPRVHAEPSTPFGDLCAEVFTARADDRPARGADVHVEATVTLEDIARGARRAVTAHRQAACDACAGTGTSRVTAVDCLACEGRGSMRVVHGHMIFTTPCGRCRGEGRRTVVPCRACAGRGVEARADTVTIDVPPGIHDGAVLRVPGLGHAGRRGGPPGDAHVSVRVAPHLLHEVARSGFAKPQEPHIMGASIKETPRSGTSWIYEPEARR
jgi:molecular chaperone DnaJ